MKRKTNVEELLEENQVKIYRSLFQIEKYPAINRMKLNEITASFINELLTFNIYIKKNTDQLRNA